MTHEDPRDTPIEQHGRWMDGSPLNPQERSDIAALRNAGCRCLWPLIGHRPGVGPRCRMCNVQARGEVL